MVFPGPLALEVNSLSKTFGNQKVLDIDHFEVAPGEVHALVGANGSGKSTFVKILSGYHQPDPEGRLHIFGREVALPMRNPVSWGLGVIHQDLGLVPDMSVLENISLGVNFDVRGLRPINWKAQMESAVDFIERLGIDLDPRAKVGSLQRGARTVVAIARTLRQFDRGDGSDGKRLLLLDEPTVSFDREEVEVLFRIVRSIVDEGSSVIFISHRLPEVVEISNRITVLRDGKLIETVDAASTTIHDLVPRILGQDLVEFFPERPPTSRIAGNVLRIRELAGGAIVGVDLEVARGEVVGVTGLEGMGHDDLPYLLVGLKRKTSGVVHVEAVDLSNADPRAAKDNGVIIVPSDRARDGLWVDAGIFENLSLPQLGGYFHAGRLDKKSEFGRASELVHQFRVKAEGAQTLVKSLSGGNQQKVVMARALQQRPKVLILHQPTVGVDAGSRKEILQFVLEAANEGSAVLYVSNEYEELANICDRVIVVEGGRITGELTGTDLDEGAILRMCHAR